MKVVMLFATHKRFTGHLLLVTAVVAYSFLASVVASAQTVDPDLKPDLKRALSAQPGAPRGRGRISGYVPAQAEIKAVRPLSSARTRNDGLSLLTTPRPSAAVNVPATSAISPATPLTQILHTSQLSLSSSASAGTDEQFVDRNGDLIADERTTFDSVGGSFDIAVGRSGARYEVYSATLNNTLVGVLVVALDTNGDYRIDSSTTFNLRTDFALRSAAGVVSGTSKTGREFVIVSSSGYFNEANPNDPNNEPSPGVILLVRDPTRAVLTRSDRASWCASVIIDSSTPTPLPYCPTMIC